jgi:hypothetical protein
MSGSDDGRATPGECLDGIAQCRIRYPYLSMPEVQCISRAGKKCLDSIHGVSAVFLRKQA